MGEWFVISGEMNGSWFTAVDMQFGEVGAESVKVTIKGVEVTFRQSGDYIVSDHIGANELNIILCYVRVFDHYVKRSETYINSECDNKFTLKRETYTRYEADNRYALKTSLNNTYNKLVIDNKFALKTYAYSKSTFDEKYAVNISQYEYAYTEEVNINYNFW